MVVLELRDLARRGDAGAEALACAIDRVPGLADAVLRVANGPELRCGPKISGVQRAVILLGARAIVEIALALLEPLASAGIHPGMSRRHG